MGIHKKHIPGNTCCGTCPICRIDFDDFNRANSTSLGADWDEAAGNWEILSNTLSVTTTEATVWHTTANMGFHVVTVRFKGDDAGDTFRLKIGEDATTFCYVEIQLESGAACGVMRLFDNLPVTTGSYPMANLVQDQWHTLRVCYYEGDEGYGVLVAKITTAAGNTLTASANQIVLPFDVDRVALGTADTVTSRVYFDDFCWQRHRTATDTTCPDCIPLECGFFSDDFNRSDSTTIGCPWSEITSTWTITSNTLRTTSATSTIINLAPQPMNESRMIASVRFKCADDGDKARVLVNMHNVSFDWLGAEFEVKDNSCGVMRLFKRVSGVETQLGIDIPVVGLVPDQWHTATVCFGEGTFNGDTVENMLTAKVVTFGGYTRVYSQAQDPTAFAFHTGLEVKAVTTEVLFDDFSVSYSYHSVYAFDCANCGQDVIECAWDGSEEGNQSCDWDQVSGTWTDFGTTDDNAILKLKLPHPHWDVRSRIYGIVNATTTATEVKMFVAYKDSTTNMGAKLTISNTCGELSLFQNGSTISGATLPIEPCTAGEDHVLCVSYDGTTLRADVGPMVDGSADKRSFIYRHIAAAATADAAGYYVAVGTGTNPGTVTFGPMVATPAYHTSLYPDCQTCDTCHLYSDADVANTCEWDSTSGTVVDANGGVKISTVNGWARYKANDGVSNNAFVFIKLKGMADNQTLRVHVNDAGDRTGPWVELEFLDSGATMIRLSTGQEEATLTACRPGEQHTLTICLNGTTLHANLDVQPGLDPPIANSLIGTLGAVATGKYLVCQLRTTAGDAYFENIQYQRMHVPKELGEVSFIPVSQGAEDVVCQKCYSECDCCEDDLLPSEITIEFEGLTFNGGGWYTCPGFDGTCANGAWILPTTGTCIWQFDSWPDDVCGSCSCDGAPTGAVVIRAELVCYDALDIAERFTTGGNFPPLDGEFMICGLSDTWPSLTARLWVSLQFGFKSGEAASHCTDCDQQKQASYNFFSDPLPHPIDCLHFDRLPLYPAGPDFSAVVNHPCHPDSWPGPGPDRCSGVVVTHGGNGIWTPGNAMCYLSSN